MPNSEDHDTTSSYNEEKSSRETSFSNETSNEGILDTNSDRKLTSNEKEETGTGIQKPSSGDADKQGEDNPLADKKISARKVGSSFGLIEELEFRTEDSDGNSITSTCFNEFDADLHNEQLNQAITNLVTSSEEVNNRRQSVNQFFLTINTLILGGIGWMFTLFLDGTNPSEALPVTAGSIFLTIVGMALCHIWRNFLLSFWCVSRSKIEMMKTLETKLKVKVFSTQYKLVEANNEIFSNVVF